MRNRLDADVMGIVDFYLWHLRIADVNMQIMFRARRNSLDNWMLRHILRVKYICRNEPLY